MRAVNFWNSLWNICFSHHDQGRGWHTSEWSNVGYWTDGKTASSGFYSAKFSRADSLKPLETSLWSTYITTSIFCFLLFVFQKWSGEEFNFPAKTEKWNEQSSDSLVLISYLMFIQVLLATSAYMLKKLVQLSGRESHVCDNENQQNILHG